jgi:pimeloyl-ACP methyl ester carboxylesterase
MGGMTAFEMYRQAPGRFSGLVLIDTSHTAPMPGEAGLWTGTAQQAGQMGVASLISSLVPDMLTGTTRTSDTSLVTYLSGLIKQASQNGAVAGANALAARPDSTATQPLPFLRSLSWVKKTASRRLKLPRG